MFSPKVPSCNLHFIFLLFALACNWVFWSFQGLLTVLHIRLPDSCFWKHVHVQLASYIFMLLLAKQNTVSRNISPQAGGSNCLEKSQIHAHVELSAEQLWESKLILWLQHFKLTVSPRDSRVWGREEKVEILLFVIHAHHLPEANNTNPW